LDGDLFIRCDRKLGDPADVKKIPPSDVTTREFLGSDVIRRMTSRLQFPTDHASSTLAGDRSNGDDKLGVTTDVEENPPSDVTSGEFLGSDVIHWGLPSSTLSQCDVRL